MISGPGSLRLTMKKIYTSTLILILLAILVALAPRMLNFELIRSQVAKRLSAKSGWQIDAAQLNFYWFPTPNFSLKDTTISNDNFLLVLPETRIFPYWRSLLSKEFDLKEITLVRPELQVNSLNGYAGESTGKESILLPRALINIDDGSVIFNDGVFAEGSRNYPLVLSEIDAEILLTPEMVDLKLSGSSSFFNTAEIDGTFDPASRSYGVSYEIRGLQAYSLLPALLGGDLLPVESTVSLRGEVNGSGLANYKASVSGDFPCYVTPPGNDVFLLDCGNVEMEIEKDAAGFMVSLDELQLKNPGLVLSGRVGRTSGSADGAEPVWLVDLAGKDLDLGAIRQGVLSLWGDHHVARTVSDIVLAGRASSASYYFKAPLAGFKDLRQMQIKVDVDGAEIHPPHTELFLDGVVGAIEIIDGYLSGEGLVAMLGNSRGTNCSLFLDLADRGRDFKLELDIDADLAALPEVLHGLIKHERFRKEVQLFTHAEGSASGHLTIGDKLDDLKVFVEVGSVNGGAKYERMGWPFRIRQGALTISPGSIAWHDIKGSVGEHLVQGSDGEFSWADKLFLEVKSLKGSVDAAALLRDLGKIEMATEKIAKVISVAEGPIILKNGRLSGLIKSPESWQYSFEALTSGSRWTSPLLPQTVLAETARVIMTDKRIDLGDGKFWFQEQPLLISGIFNHLFFQDWQGEIAVSGTIRNSLAEWIREKDWIPEPYFPKVPCTLDKLKVSWSPEQVLLTGGITAGMGGISSPAVRVDMELNKELVKIHELVVVSPEEQGKLSLEYLKKDGGKLDLNWHGFVDSVTVESLLNTNIIRAERIEGDFNFRYLGSAGKRWFSGWVKANDLEWFVNPQRKDILIPELKLTGSHDGAVVIEQLSLDVGGDRVELTGTLGLEPDLLTFDIDLSGERLRVSGARNIISDFKSLVPDKNGKDGIRRLGRQQVKGVLNFLVGRVESGNISAGSMKREAPSEPQSPYVFSPAKGFISVDSLNSQYAIDLRNSKVCGLDISGTFNSPSSRHESSLNVFTDSSSPPLFKEVLPCFGFKNAWVDGDMHLDINLKGKANKWLSGNANLFSKQGYIHRLGFLSKAFKLINLRGLFAKENLPDFANDGFAYSKIDITSHVEDNKIYVEKAIVDGEGLNLFGHGTIEMADWSGDLTLMIAPLKSVDAVLTNIPLLGKVLGGEDKAVISIPIGLKGDLRDLQVIALPPEAIGKGFINLITNTLKMPFRIFSPLIQENQGQE
jgi:hypothetical protein